MKYYMGQKIFYDTDSVGDRDVRRHIPGGGGICTI